MTFKEKLVKLRKLNGLTQDEFASAVGVSRQAVYKWESGQSYPEVSKLLEMKVIFNISIDDLLDDNYEVVVPEKKKKRVAKEAAVTNDAEKDKPVIDEAAAVSVGESAEEEAEKTVPESEADEDSKKKVGFFGRIFGRK